MRQSHVHTREEPKGGASGHETLTCTHKGVASGNVQDQSRGKITSPLETKSNEVKVWAPSVRMICYYLFSSNNSINEGKDEIDYTGCYHLTQRVT